MGPRDSLLDNPVWWALITEQAGFAQGNGQARRYLPDILPFVGFAEASAAAAAGLDPFLSAGGSFYVVGELPPLPSGWHAGTGLPCAQLLAPLNSNCLPQPNMPILPLGEADKDEMYRLITAIQPGYYCPDTLRLGHYIGIRLNGRLIAMAGERLRLTGFSELSAVCTHPDHTGHGYAQQLIGVLCRRQVAAGITPFLHVSLANQRALRLYLHLGFRHRREIVFHRVRKIQ